ncbi:ImmA/IrrE family metallo-endopeptidase [Aurantimonas sp. A2-1-M11]|uniref:ImmA/IrrE family metallo-endopeptidase n=1 Tax=Aurantimonas sp. A2-1-M11 TaxID=3113712 RepID=UPI002F927D30
MKPIKSESDYETALARVGDLMSAEPGTPEFEELDFLSALVETWEAKHHSIAHPDPIDAIAFRMDQAGLARRDLVPFIGSASKVSEVMNRKRPLTLAMIKALHAGLGIPAEVLLREPEAKDAFDASKWPWHEIVRRGWVAGFAGTAKEARSRAGELARSLMPQASTGCIQPALYRRSIRAKGTTDEHAVAAWTSRIVSVACDEALPGRYEPGSVDADFVADLVRLSFLDDGPRLAREFLGKNGIHLVIERHLPKTRIDGAATKLADGSPVIGMSLRHDRLDNFWFCLAHELAHVALHLDGAAGEWFVDDLDSEGTGQEREADDWAREALLPTSVWFEVAGVRREAEVRAWARKLSISPAIIAGRLRFEQKNYRLMTDLVGQGGVRSHFGVV